MNHINFDIDVDVDPVIPRGKHEGSGHTNLCGQNG